MMNEITLKARLADADPNAIEKGLNRAAGGNLRERFIPGYAKNKYGQAEVEQANRNADTGADSLTRNTQETNRNALGQRQVDGGKPVSNFNPAEPRPIGREQPGGQSDIQNAANQKVALRAANQGQTAELTPLQTMGAGSNGTGTPDTSSTKTEVKNGVDGASEIKETTVHSNDVVPQVETTEPTAESVPPQPNLPPPTPAAMATSGPAASPQPSSAPPSPQPSPIAPPAPPAPAGAPPPPPPPAPAGGQTNSGSGQQANMGNTFNIGGMGGGGQGQGQGQGQAQQQMNPQQAAKGVQVANAAKRSQTKGGLATNALAGVATMGLSNVAGAAYNAYQRNQGDKQLQQLSKMLLIRNSIGIRNTTGALRRGRI